MNEFIKQIPVNMGMSTLEYGAGKGITSFLLKDYLKEVTMMDNSIEMVRIIEGRIIKTKSKNFFDVFLLTANRDK